MDYPQYVVLDANGVLYQVGDDIHELFIPFLRARGCSLSEADVVAAYRECSLGRFDSTELWRRCGMQQNLDADYLPLYQPHEGVFAFLRRAKAGGVPVAVLTNDVAAWSAWVAPALGFTAWIDHWVNSSVAGARKPDPAVYQALAATTGWALADCLFVDDRSANLDAAAALGMQTAFMPSDDKSGPGGHRVVATFDALAALVFPPA